MAAPRGPSFSLALTGCFYFRLCFDRLYWHRIRICRPSARINNRSSLFFFTCVFSGVEIPSSDEEHSNRLTKMRFEGRKAHRSRSKKPVDHAPPETTLTNAFGPEELKKATYYHSERSAWVLQRKGPPKRCPLPRHLYHLTRQLNQKLNLLLIPRKKGAV